MSSSVSSSSGKSNFWPNDLSVEAQSLWEELRLAWIEQTVPSKAAQQAYAQALWNQFGSTEVFTPDLLVDYQEAIPLIRRDPEEAWELLKGLGEELGFVPDGAPLQNLEETKTQQTTTKDEYVAVGAKPVISPSRQRKPSVSPPASFVPSLASPDEEVMNEVSSSQAIRSVDDEEVNEISALSLHDFLKLIEQDFVYSQQAFETRKKDIKVLYHKGYEKELGKVSSRLEYWKQALIEASKMGKKDRLEYEEDIRLGLQILMNRLLRLTSDILSEPVDEDRLSKLGLHHPRSPKRRSSTPGTPKEQIPQRISTSKDQGKTAENPFLINQEVGYGPELELRSHQIEGLERFRGKLRYLKERYLDPGLPIPIEVLQDNIVMPVGSGKTRLMIALFALAMEEGLFQEGDVFVLVSHTDQIYQQNKEAIEKLGSYFSEKMGREMRVAEYKGPQKNVSGDVIVLSQPSVNTEETLENFKQALVNRLKGGKRIVQVNIDEIHHLGLSKKTKEKTWLNLMEVLRSLSPSFYRMGATATPTGKEGSVLYRMTELEMRRRGLGPYTYYIGVSGIDLSQVKVSSVGGEFNQKELRSVFLDHPERNTRAYAKLATYGFKKESLSPSGKPQLKATAVFGNDLTHAAMQMNDYVSFFKTGQANGLGKRKLIVLGEKKGAISDKDLKEALEKYRRGEVDGIVALVSGSTKQPQNILNYLESGEIEALFSVNKFVEGADLYMVSHQIGGRAGFSRIELGQERGRINRGEGPKLMIDIVDRYVASDGRHLMNYGLLMGLPTEAQRGEYEGVYDVRREEIISTTTPDKDEAVVIKSRRQIEQDETKVSISEYRQPYIDLLQEILTTKYDGDTQEMALDLGVEESIVRAMLRGEEWNMLRSFLRRLGTLLYEKRQSFVDLFNDLRGYNDERVSEEDYAMLAGALKVFEEEHGGTVDQAVTVTREFWWGKDERVIT